MTHDCDDGWVWWDDDDCGWQRRRCLTCGFGTIGTAPEAVGTGYRGPDEAPLVYPRGLRYGAV